jgi:molecular chaperone DnaK (HSP70)
MPTKLAIDFGTTNTLLMKWEAGKAKPETLPIAGLSLEANPPLIPSRLYVADSGVLAGAETLTNSESNDANRLFTHFKREIIRAEFLPSRVINNEAWGAWEAGAAFLGKVLSRANLSDVEQVILTVPVSAFEDYINWLDHVMAGLPTERVHVVDESTAAALGYAVNMPNVPVLVVDFGGGTLDLSLVRLPESLARVGGALNLVRRGEAGQYVARVLAKAGSPIGGLDIDMAIADYVLASLGHSRQSIGGDWPALLLACEQAKIALSGQPEVSFTVHIAGATQTIGLSQADLRRILDERGFFVSLRHSIDKVMGLAQREGFQKEDIPHVLMVGGTSLMPAVQTVLRSYFPRASVRADKPFTAVAEGALQLATGHSLEDYVINSYGLRYLDSEGQHQFEEIIPQGSRYPTAPVEIILTAAHADQQEIEFVIGLINTDLTTRLMVRYEEGKPVFVSAYQAGQAAIYKGEESHEEEHLAVMPLNAVAPNVVVPLNPPGRRGQERLRAAFFVDAKRKLRVTVTDMLNKQRLIDEAEITTVR